MERRGERSEERGEKKEERRERREETGEERRGEERREEETGGQRREDDSGLKFPYWCRAWGVVIFASTCYVSAFVFVDPIRCSLLLFSA